MRPSQNPRSDLEVENKFRLWNESPEGRVPVNSVKEFHNERRELKLFTRRFSMHPPEKWKDGRG